jgi:hypothetical protein
MKQELDYFLDKHYKISSLWTNLTRKKSTESDKLKMKGMKHF